MKAIMDMKWVIIALGLLLVLAPFLSGFDHQSDLLWLSIISGVVFILLGWFEQYLWAAVTGLVVFAMPWIFGFPTTTAATWFLVIGEATLLIAGNKTTLKLAGSKGLLADNDDTKNSLNAK